MTQHWHELLPIDRYLVTSNGLLHDYDRKVLTFLYQPLIGPVAYSLYMTLWGEVEENQLTSAPSSHYYLMNYMSLNLKDIYHARLKLEGMGLIKTFLQEEDESRSFVYELQRALTPKQFFQDGFLSIFLYRKIGKGPYLKLKSYFTDKDILTEGDYHEVTRAFQDVFTSSSIPSMSLTEEDRFDLEIESSTQYIHQEEPTNIVLKSNEIFDFDLLLSGLKQTVRESSLTAQVKEAIGLMSFLYGIDAIQMKNIVLDALTHDDTIDIEELRKAAQNWYRIEHGDTPPRLVEKIQPPLHQTERDREPITNEEKRRKHLEMISPRQLLEELSGGGVALSSDLELIEEIMFTQKLHPGVVNVLIEYVMLKTDMKLSKGYVQKIATHWARKQVKTVKEAMDLARNEHRQYIEWQEGKKTKKPHSKGAKPTRKELLPEWFKEDEKKQESTNPSTTLDPETESKKRELEEKIKSLRRRGD